MLTQITSLFIRSFDILVLRFLVCGSMDQIILVCGNWRFDQNHWFFVVDSSLGCKVLEVHEDISYEDFMRMVSEDFDLNLQMYTLKLSYISNELMHRLPQDTPPICVSNQRQLRGYLQQFRKEAIRLCVEISKICDGSVDQGCRFQPKSESYFENVPFSSIPESSTSRRARQTEKNEDDEDSEMRFDFCEDVDGASSGDEDYIGVQRKSDEEKNLPPTKRDSTLDDEYLDIEMRSLDLVVGQIYPTKADLESRLKTYSVLHRFDFNVVSSSKMLLVVKCWVQNCGWRVRASRLDAENPCFCIRILCGEHTCSVTERSSRARQATPDILGRLYLEFIGGVGPSVLPCHVAESLNKRFGLKMAYWKAHRTLKEARALVSSPSENSFDDLPSYLYMIRRANPGTVTKLEVDGNDRFKFLFIAFDASIRGFPYMRKVVVVDGTFLQGKYKGTLLTASMQDGNFNIFPMAFAVVDTENDESWEWFFRQLNRVIPDDQELAIISDRHKSITKAIPKMYPLASRGICTYHLRKNILNKFRGGESFKLFKKAATAYRLSEFNDIFGEIERIDAKLHQYLVMADVRQWSRVHFPGKRYNFTTSNIAESINHALAEARTFPIVQLLDAIRAMLTRWFAKRKATAAATSTILTPAIEKLLKTRLREATQYTVQNLDGLQAVVTCLTSSHIVNLTEKTCSCKRFDVEKIPCVHALAAAQAYRRSMIDLTDPYYYTSYLYHAYGKCVMPRDSALPVPEEVTRKVCKPPVVRNQPGRPKNSRLKSWFENSADTKRPRKLTTCSKCKGVGHNARTCSGIGGP